MRFGIIGTGRIARRFVPESYTVPDVNISAIYNPHSGRAQQFINDIWDTGAVWKPSGLSDIDELWEKADAIYRFSP